MYCFFSTYLNALAKYISGQLQLAVYKITYKRSVYNTTLQHVSFITPITYPVPLQLEWFSSHTFSALLTGPGIALREETGMTSGHGGGLWNLGNAQECIVPVELLATIHLMSATTGLFMFN